jgi:hypothetical protein
MKKLNVLEILIGVALLTAAPVSVQWSQSGAGLFLDSADA